MAIDPQSIAQIGNLGGFDAVGSAVKGKETALTIKDMLDREQMNALSLTQAKRKDSEDTAAQEILKQSKYDTPQGVLETAEKLNKVSPRAAMEFQSNAAKITSGKVQAQLDQYELLEHQQGVIVSAIDPIVAQARQIKAQSGQMAADAYVAQQLPGALQTLQATKLPNGESALSPQVIQQVNEASKQGPITLTTLESFEAKSKQGQAAIKQRIDQMKADTAVRAQDTRDRAEDEKERHDRAMETAQKAKAAGFTDQESDLLAALADANVSLPAGLRSQAQIKSTLDGLLRNHPDLDARGIAGGLKSGKLKLAAETKAAMVAGGQVGKVAVSVNEIEPFGRQVLEASNDLPREGSSLTLNGLMQKGEKELNDPRLLRLKVKLTALNNAYDQLAARGGTDAEKRAHIHELFDARLTKENIETLVKAVNEEGAGAKEAAQATIGEVSGTTIPGVAGSPGGTPGAAPAAPVLRPGQQTSGGAAQPIPDDIAAILAKHGGG